MRASSTVYSTVQFFLLAVKGKGGTFSITISRGPVGNFCTLQRLLNYYFQHQCLWSPQLKYILTRTSTSSTVVPIIQFHLRSGSFLKSIVPILSYVKKLAICHVVIQSVSYWSLTVDTRFRCQATACAICGGKVALRHRFLQYFSSFPCHYPFKKSPYSFLHPSQRLHSLNPRQRREIHH
jgi:hypothetical protein